MSKQFVFNPPSVIYNPQSAPHRYRSGCFVRAISLLLWCRQLPLFDIDTLSGMVLAIRLSVRFFETQNRTPGDMSP